MGGGPNPEITERGRGGGLETGCTGGDLACVNVEDVGIVAWRQCVFGEFRSKRFSSDNVTAAPQQCPKRMVHFNYL